MIKKLVTVVGILTVCFLQKAAAQGAELGSFDFLPQTVYANPALRPAGRVNIGIPALSGVYVGHGNNWFVPEKYIISDENGTATLDAQKIVQNIRTYAKTDVRVGIELMHVGIRIGKSYVNLRAAERAQAGLVLPKDIFYLAAYGNAGTHAFDDHTADFSDLNVDALHYREYALGYNYEINEKWSVGLTAKYLYGMERIKTTQSSLRLTTDPTDYSLSTRGSFVVNTAGIAGGFDDGGEDIRSDLKQYIIGLKNNGFGGDAGVVYRPFEKWQFEFSANDIGFIKWRNDIANYGTERADFTFNGIDLTEFIFLEGRDFNDAFDQHMDSLRDDLENKYNFDKNTGSFTTTINGYFRYGASYELYSTGKTSGRGWVNAYHGVLSSTVPFGFSAGYNQKVGKVIQAGVHFSKEAGYKGSFGAGLSLNGGFFQVYCLAENFRFTRLTRITITDKDRPDEQTRISYFSNAQNIYVRLGMNLTFGMKKADKPVGRPMKR